MLGLSVCTSSCAWFDVESPDIELVDESKKRGLHFTYLSGQSPQYRIPEIMGGGVALLDSDQDGDLDVYFVQSGSLHERSSEHANALFVNDGTGHFRVHDGKDASQNLGYGMGVAVGDFNGDALPDIFVTQVGKNVLLRNDGNNRFTDTTTKAGFRREDWSTATAFADFDLDGDLDLWVVNYIEWSAAMEPECHQKSLGKRDYCAPAYYDAPAQDRVFRNEGNGRFVDITREAGVFRTKGNGLGIAVSDFNSDGLLDVFVANDTTPNHLWLNRGGFHFVNDAVAWNCAIDRHGVARAGMGIVAVDMDDDKDQDVMVVHVSAEANYVFRNEQTYFRDIAPQIGLGMDSQRYTRFGVVVDDLNNDGWLDVYEANGAVTQRAAPLSVDAFAEPNSLFKGTSAGVFEFLGYSKEINTSRGAAVGDVDNDGRLDVIVVDRDSPVKLLMNRSYSSGHWLILDVRDEDGGVAHGATVFLDVGGRTITRVVQRASSYLTSRDLRLHFGLGNHKIAENVHIRWLDGTEQRLDRVEANQIIEIFRSEKLH